MVQTGVERILQEGAKTSMSSKKLDFDIIIFALARWDGNYSSTSYSLAKALSEHTRVFYIDNPFTIKYFYAKRKTEMIRRRKNALLYGKDMFVNPDPDYPNLTAVTPKLVLPINWMPSGFFYNLFSKINDSIVSKTIDETCKQYNIRQYVFMNSFNPHFGKYFNLKHKPAVTSYYNVDDISQGPYLNKHGVTLEIDAIKKADVTLVTSSELKKISSKHSKNVQLLANAANVKLFQKAAQDLPVPEEIKAIPSDKKIICYIGNICWRLDYELLKKTAITHSDKVLLMVGPFAVDTYQKYGLDKLSNIVFTGKKNLEELPAYLKHSHCCIIPFLCNQLTKSIYPLKINEYLSAGKPVVTTNFSEDIRSFENIIHVSDTHNDFVHNIDKAIATDSGLLQQKRISHSAPNNWHDRAQQFIGIVEEILHTKNDNGRSERRRSA
jgi:glycosyltransferase involved in cell wall biosynthesis